MPPNDLLAMPAHLLSTVVKPVGNANLGNSCYLSTLMQIIFWVVLVPLRKRLNQKKLPEKLPLLPIFLVDLEADSETLLHLCVSEKTTPEYATI